jgi:hypothetical protein
MAATGGSRERIDSLLARAKELAARTRDAYTDAWIESVSSAVAYLQGRWSSAFALATRAETMFRESCPGASWEIDSMQQIIRWSLCYLGRIDELTRVVRQGLREADERADRYSAMSARSGFPNVVWLAQDDIARAQQEADDAIGKWSQSGFHLQHLFDLFARVQIDLYAGDGEAAARRVAEKWRAIEQSGLLRVEINRVIALDLRARAAIACAVERKENRGRLLSRGAADARAIARTATWGRGLSQLLRGQMAVLAGDPGAVDLLASAVTTLDRHELPLHAAAARVMVARIHEDHEALTSAQAPIAAQAHRAESLLAMLAPALRAWPTC